MRRLTVLSLGMVLTVLGTGCGGGGEKTSIEAGGSTFAYPMMSKWTVEYEKLAKVELRYLSVGSGLGIQQMIAGDLTLGCSDAPLNDKDLEAARQQGGEVLHVPLMMGAVAPVYNVEGVKGRLKFTGQVLAEIFLCKIKRWDDRAIKHLNPDASLPSQEIVVVHRQDSSGTTYVWTEYLSKASLEWEGKLGKSKMIRWPCGLGGQGNPGVAGLVKRTPFSIGYVELNTAVKEGLDMGQVRNREGEYITPSPEAVTRAAEHALTEIPDDLRFSINNASGSESYPICGTVWGVLYKNQHAGKGKPVKDFLQWATHEGQAHLKGMGYAPLPEALVKKLEKKLDEIEVK